MTLCLILILILTQIRTDVSETERGYTGQRNDVSARVRVKVGVNETM